MRFIRGDPDNLEGKALIYTEPLKLSPNDSRELGSKSEYAKFFGVRCSVSPYDLLEELTGGDITDEAKEVAEKIKKQFDCAKRDIKSQTGLEGFVPFIALPLILSSHDEAESYSGDIMFAGRAENSDASKILISNALNIYSINYRAQLVTKMQELRVASLTKKIETFKDYTPDKLIVRISGLMSAMTHSWENKDNPSLEEQINILKQIAIGAPFHREVQSLIDLTPWRNRNNIELATKYIQVIGAVAEEKYETAAKIKNEINLHNRK